MITDLLLSRLAVEQLRPLISELSRSIKLSQQRQAIIISGTAAWCYQSSSQIIDLLSSDSWLWCGQNCPATLPKTINHVQSTATTQLLGGETDHLVYDAHSGFDPDALAATSGTLRGGGLLLLLTPPLVQWPALEDPQFSRINVYPLHAHHSAHHYLKRLVGIIAGSDHVIRWQQDRPLPQIKIQSIAAPTPYTQKPFHNQDQKEAVEAVIKVVTAQRRRPFILVADRGRGKSAAFGIAAAMLLQTIDDIIVTGPGRTAVTALFKHAEQQLAAVGATFERQADTLRVQIDADCRRLRYIAVDDLMEQQPQTQLLLVDEAAALSLNTLETLLKRYSRIAFASTEHGYEGSGRGFALRFSSILDANTRGWHKSRLKLPIRWAAGDPLELFLNRLLLLDACHDQLVNPGKSGPMPTPDQLQIEWLTQERLALDQATLRQVFGLLVLAHYRTRPYDLRHLLDGPNLSTVVLKQADRVVATLLVAAEGNFDKPTAQAVWLGKKRPQGHLLAESLAHQLGLQQAAELKCRRIVRIVVGPAYQRHGLGSRMLKWLQQDSVEQGFDYIGSSFGASTELLSFWHTNGFRPVRLSLKRGRSSAAYAVLQLKALSTEGEKLLGDARAHFGGNFPLLLSNYYQSIDPKLACVLLQQVLPAPLKPWCDAEIENLCTFAYADRPLEMVLAPLYRLVLAALTESDPGYPDMLEQSAKILLFEKCLQRKHWSQLSGDAAHQGRNRGVAKLRRITATLLRHYFPEQCRQFNNMLGACQQ